MNKFLLILALSLFGCGGGEEPRYTFAPSPSGTGDYLVTTFFTSDGAPIGPGGPVPYPGSQYEQEIVGVEPSAGYYPQLGRCYQDEYSGEWCE